MIQVYCNVNKDLLKFIVGYTDNLFFICVLVAEINFKNTIYFLCNIYNVLKYYFDLFCKRHKENTMNLIVYTMSQLIIT